MLVYGKNASLEALKKGEVEKVYLSKNFDDEKLLKLIGNKKVIYLTDGEMGRFGKNHQGIAIEIKDYEFYDIDTVYNDKNSDFIVVLDHLEDPHNFGAIIRTCESRGIKNIIIPKDRSVSVNETVMKTSVGALNHVNIIQVTNLVNAINYLKENGFFIYGAEADGINYKSVDYSEKKCLIVGSEGKGISPVVRKNCDEIISLPMKGHVNSLNASVAAAILIYGLGD